MRRFLVLALFISLIVGKGFAQDEEKNWLVRGYVKDLFTANFMDDSTVFDNLIHNRLNFKWYPNDQINVYFELRNRFFWGGTPKAIPNYGEFIDVNNDYLDLSLMKSGDSWLIHTMIDRAYLEWYKGDWEVRVGRQRINWGINLVWNPNDLFNAFSFFDFDYEERPGSDAIRIKKYTGVASSIEFASNVADNFDDLAMAGMWKWNKNNYDLQLILGKAREDLTMGFGWAGNLKNAGFKGEISLLQNYNESMNLIVVGALGIDYSFENSIYVNGSLMYNSFADVNPPLEQNVNIFPTDRLTVKDLSPFRYSTFGQVGYTFHPLVSGGMAVIYFPSERNALYLNPSLSYSIKPNLDLDMIGQWYFDKLLGDYDAQARLLILRLKWSF